MFLCIQTAEKQRTWRANQKDTGWMFIHHSCRGPVRAVSEVILDSLDPYDQLLVEVGLFHAITGFTLIFYPHSPTTYTLTHSCLISQEVSQGNISALILFNQHKPTRYAYKIHTVSVT